jgi:hypothetical protein
MYYRRVLIELLLAFALEEDFVWVAVFLMKIYRCRNVEVVEKSGYMKENGVAVLYLG